MGRSAARDATLRIVLGLFIISVGNVVGGFPAGTTGIVGLALYLLVAVPTFVYGMLYVVTGTGVVAEAATERTLEAAELTVEVSDSDDGGEGRNSGGNRGGDTGSLARD